MSNGTISTAPLAGSPVTFDVQGNGTQLPTGWITAGEGFLGSDPADAPITRLSQLMGGQAALSALDTNGDGTINASDAVWSGLRIWIDQSGSGAFSTNELFTPEQLGITAINTVLTPVNQQNNGNIIAAQSAFTFADGGTGVIASVDLQFSQALATHA